MRVVALPTVDTKHLDAIAHSFLATFAAIKARADVIHYHAIGPGIAAVLPRYASRASVALTVHGRDGERAKWGPVAKMVLTGAERLSARVPDATIVVSQDLQRHYAERYDRHTFYVPNGVVAAHPLAAAEITRRWGLEPGSYFLFVGRLVPEKAPDLLVEAFRKLPGDRRLVLAGGSSFTDDFVERLRSAASSDNRIVMTDYVYGDTLRELYTNAAAFVLPSFLEGLPLTLLEAVSYGLPVVASDIAPHLEVLGADSPGHRIFAAGSEPGLIEAMTAVSGGEAERSGAREARDQVLKRYDWDEAVLSTERIYERIVGTG
jgi:glycosyltransferase involved in cell wall biosynthesis